MSIVSWIVVLLFLLCIGSAIGALTYRLPIRIKLAWTQEAKQHLNIEQDEPTPNLLIHSKRSKCPQCMMTLSVRDLIPILSYFINGAQCRGCQQSISARYPIIESLFLVLALPIFFIANDEVEALFMLLFWASVYTGAVIDFEHMFIPDETILVALFSAFALHLYRGSELETYVLGAMAGYGVIFIVRLVFMAWKQVEGIGLGDASLMAAIGAIVGLASVYHVLILACVLGVIGHLVSNNKQLPFAPSLVAATAIIFYLNLL